jgi:hypothetical protein
VSGRRPYGSTARNWRRGRCKIVRPQSDKIAASASDAKKRHSRLQPEPPLACSALAPGGQRSLFAALLSLFGELFSDGVKLCFARVKNLVRRGD